MQQWDKYRALSSTKSQIVLSNGFALGTIQGPCSCPTIIPPTASGCSIRGMGVVIRHTQLCNTISLLKGCYGPFRRSMLGTST